MAWAPQVREVAWSDGPLGTREQRFDRLVRHQVYLLIGCPGMYRHRY